MPVARNHVASCTDGDHMYVFGGRIGKNSVTEGFSDTVIYTPGVGWKYGAPLPTGRGGMGRCVCMQV